MGIEGANAIAEGIRNLEQLRSLEIYIGFNNNISREGASELANAIISLK